MDVLAIGLATFGTSESFRIGPETEDGCDDDFGSRSKVSQAGLDISSPINIGIHNLANENLKDLGLFSQRKSAVESSSELIEGRLSNDLVCKTKQKQLNIKAIQID